VRDWNARKRMGEEDSHHATPCLVPTEPGQLDNCIDLGIMLSVLKFLKQFNTG